MIGDIINSKRAIREKVWVLIWLFDACCLLSEKLCCFMSSSDWAEKLTDGVHSDDAVTGLAEGPGPG